MAVPTSAPEQSQAQPRVRARFHDFILDEEEARLSRDGQVIPLPPKALAVLCSLVRQHGRLVGKDALLDAVWGHRHVTESVLKSTISQVRAALGDDVRMPRFVETSSRHGYRFVATVTLLSHAVGNVERLAEVTATAPFVGREVALQRLDQAWSGSKPRQRRIAWVSGEAGIGKTTLVDQWIARGISGRVARGHCIEPFGAGEPYLPLLEALAALCRDDPETLPLMRRFAPTWLLHLPWLQEPGEAEALRAASAGAGQDRMLRELCELIEQAARERPLLLVLEDLHWSDASTVRFIDYLARRRGEGNWMLVGTFRATELSATNHPLRHVRHELRAHGLCEEIALDLLSPVEVAELLRQSWPGADDAELATAVHAHTDGLPVFLAAVIDDLRERTEGGIPDPQACMQALALRLPDSLGGIIGKQLDRLPPEQQAVLRAASIRGQTFTQFCAAAVLATNPVELLDRLSGLARSSPWIEELGIERQSDGRLRATFRFRHALYQQAIHDGWNAADRADAHLRLAHDLASRVHAGESITPSEVAVHFERGHAFPDAVRWQAEAAASALAHIAPHEAAEQAGHGLELLQRVERRGECREHELSLHVTRGVATAQLQGLGSDAALADLERARAISEGLPHGPQHAWLMNGLGWTYFSRGDFGHASAHGLAMVHRAEQAGDACLALCAANLLGATTAYSGHLDAAQDWLDRALSLLADDGIAAASMRSIVDLETSVRVYRALVLSHRGFARAATLELQAATARARDLRQPMSLCLALRYQSLIAIRNDEPEVVSSTSTELSELVASHGVAQSIGPARWYRGWALARSGDVEGGQRLVLEGIDGHLRLGMPTGCPLAHAYAAQASLWGRDIEAARSHLHRGLALARQRGETLDLPRLLHLLAEVESAAGRVGEARKAERLARDAAAAIGAA